MTTTTTTTSSVYADFKRSTYFPSLNGIRAICAILVIKHHAFWLISGSPRIFEWGFLGVDMFFVISGFLIVTLLLRERDCTGHIALKDFYVRRTLRIFPLYYLVIAFLFLLAVGSYKYSTKSWDLYKWSFPIFLLYLQDLVPVSMGLMYHTWSLAMEEQFYLIWPSIERYFRKPLIIPALLVLIVINQLFNFGYFKDLLTSVFGPDGPMRPMYLITFTPILLGVLAAHVMHCPRIGLVLTGLLRGRWVPPVCIALAALVCEYSNQLQGVARLSVHILFCLALVAMVVNPSGIFSRFLQSRVMFYLGSISYGIYLYHAFVIWAVDRFCDARGIGLAPFQVFVLATPITIAIAAVSFRFFESPIMRLRRRKTASLLPEAVSA